jgi:hypothetical protein
MRYRAYCRRVYIFLPAATYIELDHWWQEYDTRANVFCGKKTESAATRRDVYRKSPIKFLCFSFLARSNDSLLFPLSHSATHTLSCAARIPAATRTALSDNVHNFSDSAERVTTRGDARQRRQVTLLVSLSPPPHASPPSSILLFVFSELSLVCCLRLFLPLPYINLLRGRLRVV